MTRSLLIPFVLALLVVLGACSPATAEPGGGSDESSSGSSDWQPVTISHALGETTLDTKPERVATVGWANEEVALALGIVPVGMPGYTWGDDDGDRVLPWTEKRLEELGAETPALFDETDGIDFEAVAATDPDVILAGYSGLSQEDYETLSAIAPTIAYPDAPWATPWRESIKINAAGLGMAEEGVELVADIEGQIAEAVAEHPELKGTTAMMVTHVDPSDLSKISFYSANDTRTKFFTDLGMEIPPSLIELSADSESFSGSISAEQADVFADVDIFVTYGGKELRDALESDPLLSRLPAVKAGAIVNLDGGTPLGTASNPTALQVRFVIDEYTDLLAEAARAAQEAG